jgi:hypothetical protein
MIWGLDKWQAQEREEDLWKEFTGRPWTVPSG